MAESHHEPDSNDNQTDADRFVRVSAHAADAVFASGDGDIYLSSPGALHAISAVPASSAIVFSRREKTSAIALYLQLGIHSAIPTVLGGCDFAVSVVCGIHSADGIDGASLWRFDV